jgi:hypothetical protein
MPLSLEVNGLRELRRDLRRLDPALDKEVRRGFREASRPILQTAQGFAPNRTGQLARSLRISVTQRGIAITSTHPGAGVIHWGGTIEPRGYPIEFPRSAFAIRAGEAHLNRLADEMGDAVERAADSTGWR